MIYIVGLALQNFLKNNEVELAYEKKSNSLRGKGKIDIHPFEIIFPETFMNNSGKSVAYFVKSKLGAKNLVVIQDDIDLPLGKIKISFARGSGGHKGIESIVRAIKTNEFLRIRVGISPKTPKGKTKKPGADKMNGFIVGAFKPTELEEITKIGKKITSVLEMFVKEGKEKTISVGF